MVLVVFGLSLIYGSRAFPILFMSFGLFAHVVAGDVRQRIAAKRVTRKHQMASKFWKLRRDGANMKRSDQTLFCQPPFVAAPCWLAYIYMSNGIFVQTRQNISASLLSETPQKQDTRLKHEIGNCQHFLRLPCLSTLQKRDTHLKNEIGMNVGKQLLPRLIIWNYVRQDNAPFSSQSSMLLLRCAIPKGPFRTVFSTESDSVVFCYSVVNLQCIVIHYSKYTKSVHFSKWFTTCSVVNHYA